jgi:DNA gyrase subunit A
MGRATQGVKLINLKGKDSIAAVAKVMHDEEDVENAEGVEHIENADIQESQNDGTTIDNKQNDE